MKQWVITVLVCLLGATSTVRAQGSGTVDQFLKGLASISTIKCQNRGVLPKKYEAEGKIAEARSIRGAERMICECMPSQVNALRAALSQDDLARHMTDAQFQHRYMPQIVDKCAAEQLRSTYGDGCSEQFSSRLKNSGAYCACMAAYLSGLSNATIARIGSESSDYVPRAAEAKRSGKIAPDQPENFRRFSSMDAACRER